LNELVEYYGTIRQVRNYSGRHDQGKEKGSGLFNHLNKEEKKAFDDMFGRVKSISSRA